MRSGRHLRFLNLAKSCAAVIAGRNTISPAEERAERAEALEASFEANVRHATVAFAQQVARALQAMARRMLVRRFAECGLKSTVKMEW